MTMNSGISPRIHVTWPAMFWSAMRSPTQEMSIAW